MAKKTAKKGARKKKSSDLSSDHLLKLIGALDLELLHLKFKTSPPVGRTAQVPAPAPAAAEVVAPAAAPLAAEMVAMAAPPAASPAAAETMAGGLIRSSPSLHADPESWRRLVDLCLRSIESAASGIEPLRSPASMGLMLNKPVDLDVYLIDEEDRFDQVDLHDAAFQALADAGHALAAAHAKAAASIVDSVAPGDPDADSMVEDLRALSEEIREDQNFSTVVNLLEAAAAAYANTPIPI